MKLKKRFIFVTAAISIIFGASYLVCGRVIQKTYYQNIVQFNQNRELKINLLSYNPGLFSSEARIELELDSGAKNNQKKISLKQRISHGPFLIFNTPDGIKISIAAAKVTTQLDNQLEAQLIKYTNDQKPFAVVTLIRFNNSAHSWLKLSAANQNSNTNNGNLTWATITGSLEHDLRLNSYNGTLNIPKVSYESENQNFCISDLAVYFDAGSQQDGFYNNNVINSKSISLTKNKQLELKIDNLNFKVDFSRNQQQVNVSVVASIPEAEIMQQRFVNDVATMRISNINPINIPKLGFYNAISLKTTIDMLQQITAAKETNMQLEVPKHFTNTFLSYISYELYRSSILGKYDRRQEHEIRQDINASINNLIQSVLRQKLFIEKGNLYALNFDATPKSS
jgi:uncharacterized protein YdgA (DUF945 family)